MTALSELVARTASGDLGRLAENGVPDELPAHAGLWLDRIVARASANGAGTPNGAGNGSKGQLERQRLYELAVQALQPSPAGGEPPALAAYRHLFERWRRRVEAGSPGLVRRSVTVEARSRLLLHPATGETVTEGSILLHHTYGVPYLPGSGLKGLLRSRLTAAGGAELVNRVLGIGGEEDALAAALDILDALWVPVRPAGTLPSWSPLALDVVTPHHPQYYTAPAGGRVSPSDYDEPIPVQRLTVAPGTRFLIVVEAPDVAGAGEWVEGLIQRVLLPALDEDGFGAWTSIGYGRLRSVSRSTAPAVAGSRPEREAEAVAPGPYEAVVRYEAGNGELRTLLPDGRAASAGRGDAEKLLESLPASVVERFRSRRRQARLLVEVEPLGLTWKITALRPVAES